MNVNLKIFTSVIAILFVLTSCSSENKTKPDQKKSAIDSILTVEKTNWEIDMIADELGNKAQKGIVRILKGKMTNVAVREAPLRVDLQIAKDKKSYIRFKLFSKVEGRLPKNKNINVKIIKENGETEFIENYCVNNTLIDKNGLLIEKVLSQSSPLKVNVVYEMENNSHNSIYNFEIDPEGLKEMLNRI